MSNGAALNVLVVDDDPFVLRLAELMLQKAGAPRVRTCASAFQALYDLDQAERLPNLILLDLNMPDMDGVEFLRQLAERRYDGSLVLVSGEDESVLDSVDKLVRAHRITSLGHLKKPFRLSALAALLGRWTPPGAAGARVPGRPRSAVELRAAIERGALVNYYQPKVTLATGEFVGIEALVRWVDAEEGLIYPDQFIDVAESDGLIGRLTKTVLSAGLEQVRLWREQGVALQLSVNVSMEDLREMEFPDHAALLAAANGVKPEQVMLEVTESRLSATVASALDVVTRLRLKRFGMSIDDFGTGHSSLAKLRDIPFDELKIDQSFVHQAGSEPRLRAIYGASLALGQQLNMQVVAEGVESRADWDFVRESGCHLAQGFFIARPMPAEAVGPWLLDWKGRLVADSLLAG